jgi:K+-sensing histidine kinase KdpD
LIGTCTSLEEQTLRQLKTHVFHTSHESSCLRNFLPGEAPRLLQQLNVVSVIFVPLRARNAIIGSLTYLRTSAHPEGRFTEEDHETSVNVANRAALAIDNCRLFMEAREAIRIRENLMATVSHDLKNPLE